MLKNNLEHPLETLDATDLYMQFRVMRALGYHSLFDNEFRKEISNPLRRIIYYRMVSIDEARKKLFLQEALRNTANRIGFFSDPELYREIMRKEDTAELIGMSDEKRGLIESRYEEALKNHPQMTETELAQARQAVASVIPVRSFANN
jgi:hypothetical protein